MTTDTNTDKKAAATTGNDGQDGTQNAPGAAQNTQPGTGDAGKPKEGGGSENNKTGTFLDDDDGAGDGPAGAGDWPADWRKRVAGDDEKFLKHLERMGSPLDLAKSYRELEKTKGAPVQKKELSDNPTPEELAAYRKENGIPETHEGYDLNLPDGLVIGDQDKPMVMEVLKELHGKNTPPGVVKDVLTSYYKMQDAEALKFHQAEQEAKQETVEALRQEWGPEFLANKNMITNFLQKQPDAIGETIMNARDGEGRALMNSPNFVRWLRNLVGEVDPTASLIQGGGGKSAADIEARIKEIQDIIAGPESEKYYKNPKMQEELAQLTQIQERMKSKAA